MRDAAHEYKCWPGCLVTYGCGSVATETANLHLAVSVDVLASYATSVAPIGNVSPGLKLLVVVTLPEPPVAVGGIQLTTADPLPVVTFTNTSGGQVIQSCMAPAL